MTERDAASETVEGPAQQGEARAATDAAGEDQQRRMPCPYCGHVQTVPREQCEACAGIFEPLSRQASQNHMGPWFVRDEDQPFMPGRSYHTLRRMIERGKIGPETVVRGPSTRQFWMFARETPGVAHLMGECHACHAPARPDDYLCAHCGAAFPTPDDRQGLGLGPVRAIPGQPTPPVTAAPGAGASAGSSAEQGAPPGARPPAPTPLAPARLAGLAEAPPPARPDDRGARAARRRIEALRRIVLLLTVVNLIAVGALLLIGLRRASIASGSGGAQSEPAPAQVD